MSYLEIDNVSTGTIFAYDTDTGEVIWTHEEIIEVMPGQKEHTACVSQSDCKHVQTTAEQIFPDRKIDTIIAPEHFTLRDNVRLAVDPAKKTLIQQEDKKQSLAERLSAFKQQ